MIAYDDLQYLCGLYVIIFLFYYGFYINRSRRLAAYDDPDYLTFVRLSLAGQGQSEQEIERHIAERQRRNNVKHVANMLFFALYALSFLALAKYLAGLP